MAPWGVKIDSQTAPGGVKIELRRVPGGSWKPLSTSAGVLGGAAGIPEGSRSRLGDVLGLNGSHLGSLCWSLFGLFFGDRILNTFFVVFKAILGCISGSFFESFGAEETFFH